MVTTMQRGLQGFREGDPFRRGGKLVVVLSSERSRWVMQTHRHPWVLQRCSSDMGAGGSSVCRGQHTGQVPEK